MKKLQSLKLNKFKGYELKSERLNAIHGGNQRPTQQSDGTHTDTYYNESAYTNTSGQIMWPASDVHIGVKAMVVQVELP